MNVVSKSNVSMLIARYNVKKCTNCKNNKQNNISYCFTSEGRNQSVNVAKVYEVSMKVIKISGGQVGVILPL